jgi:hypothetical protein
MKTVTRGSKGLDTAKGKNAAGKGSASGMPNRTRKASSMPGTRVTKSMRKGKTAGC